MFFHILGTINSINHLQQLLLKGSSLDLFCIRGCMFSAHLRNVATCAPIPRLLVKTSNQPAKFLKSHRGWSLTHKLWTTVVWTLIITSFHETKKVKGSEGITVYHETIKHDWCTIEWHLPENIYLWKHMHEPWATHLKKYVPRHVCSLFIILWGGWKMLYAYLYWNHLSPISSPSTKILGTVQCRCACSNRGASSIVRLGQFLDCWVGWPQEVAPVFESSNPRIVGLEENHF